MHRTLIGVIGLCFAAALLANACTKDSTEAREVAGEEQTATLAQSTDSAESAEAFKVLMQEITTAQKTIRNQGQLVARIEGLLKDFIANYPGTEEGADARLNLGGLYGQLSRTDEAVAVLYEVIDGGTASNEKIGYAHYLLGEAYKSGDQFDKAKKQYEIVVKDYAHLGPRVVGAAKANLDDIETLKQLAIGSKPIPFEVKDTSGEVISLDKYRGKVVLLDFWATWCGPCRVEMPNVVKLYKKHHKEGFEIIGISLDRNKSAMDNYVEANGMAWPQFFDGKYWQNEIAMMYKVRAIPATYLIDRRGIIRYRSLRGRQLEEAVQKLVKEKAS
jgi:peroxiredoxin